MSRWWDYLIVTASNEAQAGAYELQLARRQELGLLPNVKEALVVADPGGQRIGSGGSTLCCLMQVLQRELHRRGGQPHDEHLLEQRLRALRILIIHAGGDSRRLPAYGPCGKIYVPVPGPPDHPLGTTLFDRQLPVFMGLPSPPEGAGQVVITAGDALVLFDPSVVQWAETGLTALGCYATAEAASKHGVFCGDANGAVRLYLQKPSTIEQVQFGAVNAQGQAILDIGVMSFDAATAVALLKAFGVAADAAGQFHWPEPMKTAITSRGLDFYREICCALGRETTAAHHLAQARSAGSSWDAVRLADVFAALRTVPFHVQVVPQCSFLHFGTTRQLIHSGQELFLRDTGAPPAHGLLSLNNELAGAGQITGSNAWVEGCSIQAPLRLAGDNVVVGCTVAEPLALPAGACLDVVFGRSRANQTVHFIRPHGFSDTFKDPAEAGGTFCGQPLLNWLAAAGMTPDEVWDATLPPPQRSLWNARLFPAEAEPTAYRRWLWMFAPASASAAAKQAFQAADRYSSAEISLRADPAAFYARRMTRKGVILPGANQ